MPQIGEQIGPYTLIKQLGRGAFGLVWLAERRGAFATTQVALKLALDDEPDLAALAKESKLWAQLGRHNNLLPIIEADKYGDYMVLVSEYAPDGSLDGWLRRNNGSAPSIESAVAMTIGILNGLEYLHSKKVIHRDLKPANILLQGETPRLADFGLARVLKSSMKSTGVAGTPAYMAPEVFSGERLVESDLWSVGVILYQLLSGHLPFSQTDMMALLGAIAQRNPEPLPSYIPENLVQIISKALQKNKDKRFQSAAEMRLELQKVIDTGAINVTNANLEDDRPTAILDTLPGVGLDKKAVVLQTVPVVDTKEIIPVTEEFKEKVTLATNGQKNPETTEFAQLKPIEIIPNTNLEQKGRSKYKVALVSLFLVVGLCANLLNESKYFFVFTSKDSLQMGDTAPLKGSEQVQVPVPPEAPEAPKAPEVRLPEVEQDLEIEVPEGEVNLEGVSTPPPSVATKTKKENQELLEKIDEKASQLSEKINQVTDTSKQESLKNRFAVIKESLSDKDLNDSNPSAPALYRSYLMNLDSLNIEANSYLSPLEDKASLKKSQREDLNKSVDSLERIANILPEGKQKKVVLEVCANTRGLNSKIAVSDSEYQNYKNGLDQLLKSIEITSSQNGKLISINSKKEVKIAYSALPEIKENPIAIEKLKEIKTPNVEFLDDYFLIKFDKGVSPEELLKQIEVSKKFVVKKFLNLQKETENSQKFFSKRSLENEKNK